MSTKTPQQQKLTTLNVPSTSYIYSPNPITRRPTTKAPTPTVTSTKAPLKTTTANQKEKNTSSKPVIVINQSNNDVEGNYVVISGGGITKLPSPTVHITPKPITNLLTSSTMNQIQTKKPPNKIGSTTERPPSFFSVSTTPGPFISSSIYYPPSVSSADFNNEGYFAVVTHRPGVSSTAIYAVSPGLLQQVGGEETPIIQNEELSNFPPVRNPNLNMTAPQPVMDESEISTPSFVEDAQLSNKIDLLVNKLIESMQPNLGDLMDIVYEKKNVSTVEGAINGSKKNGTSSAKPSKVTTTKPPSKVTSGRPSSTTKKPPAKTTSTAAPTKKTTTSKKPTARPAVTSTTTKKPKTTSTVVTKRPATRRTTTTTTVAPFEDEDQPVEEEDGEESESETGEETVEEGEESNVIDESEAESQPAQESGRIRKSEKNLYLMLHLIKLNAMKNLITFRFSLFLTFFFISLLLCLNTYKSAVQDHNIRRVELWAELQLHLVSLSWS